jgi:A/G-specific adenine glycosylase
MTYCEARELGTQEFRPVKKPKSQTPSYVHVAAVVVNRRKVLLAQRPSKGLLGGMWEFPNGRVDVNGDPAKALAKALKTGYNLRLRVKRNVDPVGVFYHAYSHFKVTVHAFECELLSDGVGESLKWVPLKELDQYPMGKVDRQVAQRLMQ